MGETPPDEDPLRRLALVHPCLSCHCVGWGTPPRPPRDFVAATPGRRRARRFGFARGFKSQPRSE